MRSIAFVSLFALVFTIPLEKIVMIEGVGGICRLIGYAAILTAILAVAETTTLRPLDRIHYFMAAFLMWVVLSVAWTANLDLTMTRALTFVRVVGLAWLIWEIAPGISQQAYLMLAYVLGSGVAVVMQMLQYTTGYGYRFSGGGLNVNDFALVLAMAIPMAIYLAKSQYVKKRWMRWLCGAFCPMAAFAILLSGSRMGLLVMLGMGVLFFLANSRNRWKSLFIVAIIAGIVGPTFIWFAPPKTVERILGTRKALSGDWNMRKQIRDEGLRVSAENRIVGTGIGTFPFVVGGIRREGERKVKYDFVAHNAYLAILVELGVVGLGLFATILVVCIVDIWQLRQPERIIWMVVFAGWAVGVYTGSWEYYKPTWFLFGMIAAQHSAVGVVGRRWHQGMGEPS